jgi:hypothetical protein
MEAHIKALFYQETTGGDSSKGYYELVQKVEGDFEDQVLKLWASMEFARAMEHYFLLNINLFNLRKPILVQIFYNDHLRLELIQVLVTKDRIQRAEFDVYYRLKNRQYLLIPKKEYIPAKKELPIRAPFQYTKDNKLFNTVEFHTQGPGKYGTPIIYTPMKG